MRSSIVVLAVLAASVMLATAALAAKPGSNSSTGVGSVFVSNPVESLGDESLTYQNDSGAAVPAAAAKTPAQPRAGAHAAAVAKACAARAAASVWQPHELPHPDRTST